ncbi:MAG: isoleucine--tRNA ligase [Acidobacteriota bacterium]
MAAATDLKKTVNLPRTSFPMKANLAANEPRWLSFWSDINLYAQLRSSRASRPLFILHDGPPYANGHIHLGQALNKILKDTVIRSRSMMNLNSPFIPGWDCHGLPIENRVDRDLKDRKKDLSRLELRRLCQRYAEKYISIQKEEFRRLGVLWDWQNDAAQEAAHDASRSAIYRTLDHDYEATIVRQLGEFFEAGHVYYGKKPVHWCPTCRTALAEAEVEYMQVADPSVYVAFPLAGLERRFPRLAGRQVFAVIWTTTPWTLPANRALCFHPDFTYVAVEIDAKIFIVARDLLEPTSHACGWEAPRPVASFRGRQLAGDPVARGGGETDPPGVVAEPPYRQETGGPPSRLILGQHVTLEQGTGIVHTAPGHGADDYYVSSRYGIKPWVPVDDDGRFIPSMVPSWGGQSVFSANPAIVADLEHRGLLLAAQEHKHDYPHCWRCRGPIVFRATPQWFIAMDHAHLRQKALSAIHRTSWKPASGETRISSMVENRPDWCISRQRSWGVPIPVLACTRCSRDDRLVFVSSPRLFSHVAAVFAEEGSNAWFGRKDSRSQWVPYASEAEARARLLPRGITCPQCGRADHLSRRFEIVDVWFESGTSHASVLSRPGLRWPADLYLEGHDQYRGWFHSSLLVAMQARQGQAPYKEVITHGFTLDGKGHKMSKSLGNTMSPMELVSKRGADILRLWVSMVDYIEDMWVSEESLTRHTDAYRKIRNTFRYILGNLTDFTPGADALPMRDLEEIDRYILVCLDRVQRKMLAGYEQGEFHVVAHALHHFCGVTLSAFYLDVIKDRLYTSAPASHGRRSAQTALWQLGSRLCRLMAPILCFTAEEVWQLLPGAAGEHPSVHLALFPEELEAARGFDEVRWRAVMALREEVARCLEEARRQKRIGSALDARITLAAQGPLPAFEAEFGRTWQAFAEHFLPQFSALFIVSEVRLAAEPSAGSTLLSQGSLAGLSILVEPHPGTKCPRCWNYSEEIGQSAEFSSICPRCASRVAEGLAAGAWSGKEAAE